MQNVFRYIGISFIFSRSRKFYSGDRVGVEALISDTGSETYNEVQNVFRYTGISLIFSSSGKFYWDDHVDVEALVSDIDSGTDDEEQHSPTI